MKLTRHDTTFQDGKFRILLTLPSDYPFKPPTLNFATKIFHPNVSELESLPTTGVAAQEAKERPPSEDTPPVNFCSATTSGTSTSITEIKGGMMCLGMLKQEEWKPSSRIAGVLDFARQLLVEPAPEDAVEGHIAELYNRDRKEFEKQAREWTLRYAS